MRRRIAMLAAVAAVSGVITIFAPTTAADAVPHELCAGVGQATFSSPFVFPVIGQTDGNFAPPFQLTLTPRSATFLVHFAPAGACFPSLSGLSALSSVHGWCGLSVGSGITSKDDLFHWVGVGDNLVVTGGITGVARVEPDFVAGDSCFTGADNFLVTGAFVRQSCGLVNLPSVLVATVSIPPATVHPVPGVLSEETHGRVSGQVTVCA